MKYIYLDDDEVWQLDSYFDYLSTISNVLPPDLLDFCSKTRYYIHTRESTHDSWISKIDLKDQCLHSKKTSEVSILIELLGPYHDRIFVIQYIDVSSYNISAFGNSQKRFWGDLLVHELRINEKGEFEHELCFSNEGKIEIACKEIFFKEVFLTTISQS